MVKCSGSPAWSLALIFCALLPVAGIPAWAESTTAVSNAEQEKRALFLEAREANRDEARRLSTRGAAGRPTAPDSSNRSFFGRVFRHKETRNPPAEIAGIPAETRGAATEIKGLPAAPPRTSAPPKPAPRTAQAPAASPPSAKPVAVSKPPTPAPTAKTTPVSPKAVPRITAAPAPPKAAPPPEPDSEPETSPPAIARPADSETALQLPDVQVQTPAPASGPSFATYDDISIRAESRAELLKGALVYEGNVVMNSPAFRIESNRISVGFENAGDKITQACAVGSVSVRMTPKGSRPPVNAQSARAHFDPADGSITLSGWPEYSKGGERRVATTPDTVIVLYIDGRVETEGETKLGLAGK